MKFVTTSLQFPEWIENQEGSSQRRAGWVFKKRGRQVFMCYMSRTTEQRWCHWSKIQTPVSQQDQAWLPLTSVYHLAPWADCSHTASCCSLKFKVTPSLEPMSQQFPLPGTPCLYIWGSLLPPSEKPFSPWPRLWLHPLAVPFSLKALNTPCDGHYWWSTWKEPGSLKRQASGMSIRDYLD